MHRIEERTAARTATKSEIRQGYDRFRFDPVLGDQIVAVSTNRLPL